MPSRLGFPEKTIPGREAAYQALAFKKISCVNTNRYIIEGLFPALVDMPEKGLKYGWRSRVWTEKNVEKS